MCTRTERLDIRLEPAERDALDFLAQRWASTRSQVVRSMIVGAALTELGRGDAFEPHAAELAPLDDVLAGL